MSENPKKLVMRKSPQSIAKKIIPLGLAPWIYSLVETEIKQQLCYKHNIKEIKVTEANELIFPPTHPEPDILYAQHPFIPKTYYPASTFHKVVFQQKFVEVINLLMNLGAKEIKVEHIRGWSREIMAGMSAPINGVNIGGSAGLTSKGNDSLLFEAILDGNIHPAIPESLIWYKNEPTWQTIAEGRIKHGLTEFSLAVNSDNYLEISADLKASAPKMNIELGGKFVDFEETTWNISGKFRKE